ncbi:MAG: UDP-N-acetylmuramate--L-alanine ligase [bacterium]|nr:UDP-N-acetylmuramate--L-alanine ligase [bacterium]
MNFKKIKSVHFIGIGGIGVSAIARYFLAQGTRVSGTDRASSEITEALQKEGVAISIDEEFVRNIPTDSELIIYSAALEVAEPEFMKEMKKLSVPALSYSEALGEISKSKRTIAISGTHGKTTTTAMIASVLIDAGLEPTVIVGSVLVREESNFVGGKGEWLVVEADEYRRSFLSLSPEVLVITNIDRDHLDYFKDIDDIRSAYAELSAKVPKEGTIVTDLNDENVWSVIQAARPVRSREGSQRASASNGVKAAKAPILDYTSVGAEGLQLKFPGAHNIANAQAALAVAGFLGISPSTSLRALNEFRGTWRRFEHLGETKCGALVYDDYAHNPQKIQALLAGVKEQFPDKRVIAIFQPHLYSRTKHLLPEFADSFADADLIILAPIFPAREEPDPSISHKILAEEIKKQTGREAMVLDSFKEIAQRVNELAGKDDIILTIGAGDIYKVAHLLVT